jgi:MinD-like ATPase involved in chromosome partitioning or flagellar assembly
VYTVTFYSFKGGVGRTFSLVNVATILARAGRKVLMVDFDLEAPGIQTFELFRPPNAQQGMVEYVYEYTQTGRAPDVRDFVYDTLAATDNGRLLLMPAGRCDADYRAKLSSIHWQSLYAHSDGYLMFEDLKAQWKDYFNPDYVFIDSRTGHTDVEGICTRQLPDAVTLLFFPNEQNLLGLKEVVKDIRSEVTRSRRDVPKLHFVVSNVPELDDEERILEKRLRNFSTELAFDGAFTIPHYPSLSLVNQTIFAIERPNSRLTKSYQSLADVISDQNMEDRRAAIAFLRKQGLSPALSLDEVRVSIEDRLQKIREHHPDDGEILSLVARLKRSEGRIDEANLLFERAVDFGDRSAATLLERAAIRISKKEPIAAIEDIRAALGQSHVASPDVARAVRLLGEANEDLLVETIESPAMRSLPPAGRLLAIEAFMLFDKGLKCALALLLELKDVTNLSDSLRDMADGELILCLIGDGQFDNAIARIPETDKPEQLGIEDAFNYAMSLWGKNKKIPEQLFRHVIELDAAERKSHHSANYYQCLALVHGCVGDRKTAESLLQESIERIGRFRDRDFSCWRYRYAKPKEFTSDCESIRKLIRGEPLLPSFIDKSSVRHRE